MNSLKQLSQQQSFKQDQSEEQKVEEEKFDAPSPYQVKSTFISKLIFQEEKSTAKDVPHKKRKLSRPLTYVQIAQGLVKCIFQATPKPIQKKFLESIGHQLTNPDVILGSIQEYRNFDKIGTTQFLKDCQFNEQELKQVVQEYNQIDTKFPHFDPQKSLNQRKTYLGIKSLQSGIHVLKKPQKIKPRKILKFQDQEKNLVKYLICTDNFTDRMKFQAEIPVKQVIRCIVSQKFPKSTNFMNYRIIFRGKHLKLNQSLENQGVKKKENLHLVFAPRLKGGGEGWPVTNYNFHLSPDLFDPDFDRLFKREDYSDQEYRGNELYVPPFGWYRLALRVSGKFDNGDDSWLGMSNSLNEWPVSYHGMRKRGLQAIQGIIHQGYQTAKEIGYAMGHGIYSSPKLQIAQRHQFVFQHPDNDLCYGVVFMNRYNSKTAKVPSEPDYRISQDGEIRPYGILIQQLQQF